MTTEFGPIKYRRWLQRAFYVWAIIAVLAVIIRFAK
jgi:hypothetical protein